MVLGGFGWFCWWFWVVLGGFGWFRVLVTTPKPSLNCKEATDLFLDKALNPCQMKARLRELFNGRLTSGLGLALLLLESLNGVNREPSNGPKINRQPSNERAKISRQISQISLNDCDRLT